MITTVDNQPTNSARSAIMHSIRQNLAESKRSEISVSSNVHDRDQSPVTLSNLTDGIGAQDHVSPVAMFSERLEAVGGHCFVVRGEIEAATALHDIMAQLPAPSRRIALSDAPIVQRLVRDLAHDVEEIAITPESSHLFNFDVGITTAQIAIAETGTLVLESNSERHRLVSLVPPVHIAIVEARNIMLTLGEGLNYVQREATSAMSRAITFITGPSRTADIELTLTIGVHGPKELYVIVTD